MLGQNLSIIAPELLLVLFAAAALMAGSYSPRDLSRQILWVSCGLLVIVGLWVGFQSGEAQLAFHGSFVSDGFARFSKVLILFGSAATLALSVEFLDRNNLLKFEYPILIVLSVVGMMIMVSASDLIVLYLGLELQSLALYVVASFRRDSLKSTEAGLKYFVLGALSSGLLLYGASLTYGFSGTTDFAGISTVIGDEALSLGLIFGLVFLSAGMAFKVSAAPFHMWTPDVYEGSPTPVTAFFATAPKVAAAGMLARVMFDVFGGVVSDWQQILALLAVASMFVGAVAAIGQTNIKRLMAYSSIGHMGFALTGLAAGTEEGARSLLIYLAIYVTTNIGVFAFILNMERDGKPVTDISSLGQYSSTHPARAAALAALMFSLAGVPPLVGFFGKFFVLQAAVNAGLVWLAVLAVIASVISAFYYLRIVRLMYFGTAVEPLDGKMPLIHGGLLAVSSLAMVIGVFNLFGIDDVAALAAATLVQQFMTPWPSGIRVEVHDELDSTSLECARRAQAGDTGPLWIMASTQTSARGRRGRAWVAPKGNFAASLLRPVQGGPEAAAQRSFVAALALYDAFSLLTGRPERFSLKWPNDVLLDGRKLAGILLELQGGQGGTPQVLILGIGVNLAAAPDPSGLETRAVPPTCLAEVDGMIHPPKALLDLLVRAVEAWEHRLVTDGFAPLRETWLERAAGLGQPVVARMTNREVKGIFDGIDERGFIVVGTDSGPVSLPAADLDFGSGEREMEGSDAARD